MALILACDFDGTMFGSPREGKDDIPDWEVIDHIKAYRDNGATLILWTCRENHLLDEAVERCRAVGLEFDGVNENVKEAKEWVKRHFGDANYICARKIYYDMCVDDTSPGWRDAFLATDPVVECPKRVRSQQNKEVHYASENREHSDGAATSAASHGSRALAGVC